MRLFIILSLVLFSLGSVAKNVDIDGVRPFLSLSHDLKERWDVNVFYAETDNFSNVSKSGQSYEARDLQSYFQVGFIYKSSSQLNWSFGYVFQRSNPFSDDFVNENRLWQQVLWLHPLFTGNLSHRLRLEERWVVDRIRHDTRPLATRWRYQVAFTSAFVGEAIVARSWFYSLYNEFYLSASGDRNALYSENWSYGGIGYQSKSWGKVELGPLLQVAVVNRSKDLRSFWLAQLGWSYSF